jgi:hypothetical protein
LLGAGAVHNINSRHHGLFDHLVGAGEHGRRNDEAKRLSGTEIDDRLELGRAVDWCVRWLGAFEETAGEIPARR